MISQEELKRIQQIQMEIMDEIHRLCQKHDLTYYLIAGSMLGVVRHGGFIPWDVDIDIGMPRKDYQLFKEVCARELHENFTYLDYTVVKDYSRPHALISRKNTRLEMKYDHQNNTADNFGIYLDIFPLDNAPNDPDAQKKQADRLWRLRRFKEHRRPYSYARSRFKHAAHMTFSFLTSWIPMELINEHQQKLMRQYEDQKTDYLCSMASGYPYKKQCMPREIYGTPTLYQFEDRQYYGPEKSLEYLTRLYGDYMKLPPEEKRLANLEIYQSVTFADE